MKKTILMGGIALMMSVVSCGNDSPSQVVPDASDDNANLDFTADNAASWSNYMMQVSNLLVKDATDLYDAWTSSYQGGAPFSETFRTHNDGNYPSAMSCLEEIVDFCANIANEVGTAKIGEPYNHFISGDTKRALYSVESWYSWHSRDDYSNNILSIRNSYYGTLDGQVSPNSLSAAVANVNPELDEKVRNAINTAYSSILAIPQPFRNNINSNESRAAMTACADLEEAISIYLKNALGSIPEEKRQRIIDTYIDDVVIPTYSSLKERNKELHAAVTAFRNSPTDANFASACNAWLSARAPWELSEAFLFGPVDALGLDPNMDSWPLDQDAIVQILTSGAYDNLDWSDSDNDDKIEAVQSVRGFHTLEFLLFKDGQPRKVNF